MANNTFEGTWYVTFSPLKNPAHNDLENASPFGASQQIVVRYDGVADRLEVDVPRPQDEDDARFRGHWAEGPPPTFEAEWTETSLPPRTYRIQAVMRPGSDKRVTAIGGTYTRTEELPDGPTDGSGSWVGTEQPPDPEDMTPR